MTHSRELTQLPSTSAKKTTWCHRIAVSSERSNDKCSTEACFLCLCFSCSFFFASVCTASVRFPLVSTVGGLPLPSVKPKNCCVDLKMSRTLRSHGGGTRSARGPKFILGLGFNFDHSLPENRPWKPPPPPSASAPPRCAKLQGQRFIS